MKRILFALLLFCRVAFSQQFNYTSFQTGNGLPSSETYCILQDKQGYIWVSTDNGVCRYDGKEFRTYTTTDGLTDNTIFRMCEDHKGRIWFASQSNEICYWQNGTIHPSPVSETLRKAMAPYDIIKEIVVDSSDIIWINTSKRILRFKQNPVQLEEFRDSAVSFFRMISIENKKTILSVSGNGGTYLNSEHSYLFHFVCESSSQASTDVQHITLSERGLNLTQNNNACASTALGVYFYVLGDLMFILEKDKPTRFKKMSHPVIDLVVDRFNNLWIGYRKAGVDCFKNCDLNSKPISLFEPCSVGDICVDHEGGVWLATLENGIFHIPSIAIQVYSNVPVLKDHITFIGNIKNQVYVNTFGNNICKAKDGFFSPDTMLNRLSKKYATLFSIADIRDTFYYGFSSELIRFSNRFIPFEPSSKLSRLGPKAILSTNDGGIWLFYGGGLRKLDTHTGYSKSYFSPFRASCAVAMDSDIFIGGKKGLYLFRGNKYLSLGYLHPLLKSPVTSLTSDEQGNIWATTVGNGILHLKNNRVTQFSEKEGMLSNICNVSVIDRYGNIWVGSNKGLSCIRQPFDAGKPYKIKNITQSNGLNSNEVTRLCAISDSLWVGTMSGLNLINIPQSLKPLPPSPVYISSVSVNNTYVPVEQQEFTYNQNNFKFILQGLTFTDHEPVYRYRLIGSDSTWQQSKFNEIVLNNLAPGHYTFEAQVGNADHIWSSKPVNHSFMIHKPFWLTLWFIFLEIILMGVIIYLIIFWRTRIIKRKEQEKLKINRLLAEYQMKALTAQMNPHFIFNAINSIQNFIIQNHSTLAYDYLIKFSKLIRLVLNNSKDNEITLRQELDTLALYIELEQLRFKDSFMYQPTVDPSIDTDSLMIPALLLQPYVENAIWHGLMPLKTRKGIIKLNIFKIDDHLLKITITDNGIGRKASDQIRKKIHRTHQSVGMELTGKRIELFGKDQQFSIQIIDNYDNRHEATGTTVEIILPMIELY